MVETCKLNEKTLIEFEGRLDTAKCLKIEAEVRDNIINANAPVVFDLGCVDFVSSSFLRLCIYAHKQAGTDGFKIINAGPSIKRVFKIAGLEVMLKDD
jgi:anti-anti-sigma factor